MTESSKIDLFQKELNSREMEIYTMKCQIKTMTQSLLNLESEYSTIKELYSSVASKDTYYKFLEIKAHEKDEEIFRLSQELESMDTLFKRYKLENESQFMKEIGQLKYHYDSNIVKLENAARIEKLLPVLLNQVQDLQNIINTYEVSEKKRQQEREVQFEKDLSDLKKKMLQYIREGQKTSRLKTIQKQELNNKFNQFYHTELLNELEFQSDQIDSLLKERTILEKINRELKLDSEIHLELEKVLKEKNNKYTQMITSLSMKTMKMIKQGQQQIKEKQAKTITAVQLRNKNNKIHMSQSFSKLVSNKMPISKDMKQALFDKQQLNHEHFNSNCVNDVSLRFQSQISSTKLIANRKLDYDNLLLKYEVIKAKLEGIELRYRNIFLLYDEALEKIYTEANLQKTKDLYVNLEDIKLCKFQSMNAEQKYSVLILLINQILPIIHQELLNAEMQNPSLDKVHKILLLNKKDFNKSLSSFQDTKPSITSFKVTGYKSFKNYFNFNYKTDFNSKNYKPYSILNMNVI